MKKHVFTLLCLLCSGQIFAQNAPIKFVSSIPENNAKVSLIHKLSLTFDLSAVYGYYPDIPKEKFGIKSMMNTSTSLSHSRARNIRLYFAEDVPTTSNHLALCSKAADFVANSNTIEVEFGNPIQLEPNRKYKLILYGASFYATTIDDTTDSYGAETKLNISDLPITINIEGIAGELRNAIMDSYLPENTNPLESLNDVSVKFKYKEGYGMSVAEGAKAYLRETGKEDVPSTSITVDEADNTSVIFNFGNTTLYNGHTYSIVIPENSVYPVDPSTQAPLTDKGNKEITLNDYKGASYRYLSLAARTGIVPKNNSEISYLSTVAINFDFRDTGYSISRQSNPKIKLYEGEKAEDKLVATYTCETGSATAQIWKFDLKPSTTYLLVMEKGEVEVMNMVDSKITLIPDMTNEEITATYTTPAELALVDKITFPSCVPANNAEVEKLEDVTLNIAPYAFEDNPLYPVMANADTAAILYEVTGETEKELQQIPLTISGNQEEGYSAKGTVGRTLYEGKTYKLRVPAGYFRPSEARIPDYTANDEYVLTLKGKASHYGLAGKSGIAANENLPGVGVAAFYFEGEVTPVPEAKASIYKGDSETPEKETPIFTANGTVFADFSDDTHAPYTLEAGAAYRLVLPKGSVASQADAEMMNGEVSVAFGGPAVTEYVTVSYVTDNATAKTQVAKGNIASYTFTLEPKWEVKSLLFNDAEAKESIAAGVYTTPALNADATLKMTLNYTGSTYTEGPGTGVITPDGTSLKAYSSDGNVVIEGLTPDADTVTVYSMGGAVLQHFTATNVAATITLPANTYYLVKVNDVMMKILNK